MKAQSVFGILCAILLVSLLYFAGDLTPASWHVNYQISSDSGTNFKVPDPSKDSQLTPAERRNYEACVKTASAQRADGHAKFWAPGVEMIRVTSHGYLNNGSLVLDVGGNVGFDADEFLKRYNPKIIIFEPLPLLYKRLLKKYEARAQRVQVLNVGLGQSDMELHVEVKGHDGDATSIHTGQKVTGGEIVKIRKTLDVFKSLQLVSKPIDLLHINCEGCEYDVIEAVIQSGLVYQMRHIQWATHVEYGAVGNFNARYCEIIELLKRTHKPVYRYTFTWECWVLKDINPAPGSKSP